MTHLSDLLATARPEQRLTVDQQQAVARGLMGGTGLHVYPASIFIADGRLVCLARHRRSKALLVATRDGEFGPFSDLVARPVRTSDAGAPLTLATIELAPASAAIVRDVLPWTAPRVIGLQRSLGFGDRLGLATPGHACAIAGSGCAPYFAQQSIREMTRTQRTPQDVMDAATWGVLEVGWCAGFGSDADHLKTTDDVDATLAAGFTMFTIDPGDHVDSQADTRDASALPGEVERLPWDELESSLDAMSDTYLGRTFALDGGDAVCFDQNTLARAAIKYGRAIAHTTTMYRHLAARAGDREFELEVSVDETATPTSVAEHYLIAAELRRLGVRWVGLAPRFVGAFEKGVDYRGSADAFETSFAGHVAVARTLGPYKLSIHSGSDKFSIYPAAARLAGPLVHVKTAGTSYLEALRVVARREPDLMRRILAFAVSRFEEDRRSYHISVRPDQLEQLGAPLNGRFDALLDDDAARQVLHVTFGSVLTARAKNDTSLFADAIRNVLMDHEDEHYRVLAEHLGRHVRPFAMA